MHVRRIGGLGAQQQHAEREATDERGDEAVTVQRQRRRIGADRQAQHRDDGAPGPRPEYREDYYGAFLRAPMPGPLYRMHGAITGAL